MLQCSSLASRVQCFHSQRLRSPRSPEQNLTLGSEALSSWSRSDTTVTFHVLVIKTMKNLFIMIHLIYMCFSPVNWGFHVPECLSRAVLVCVCVCVNSFVSHISYQSHKLGLLQQTVILLLECSPEGFFLWSFPVKSLLGPTENLPQQTVGTFQYFCRNSP